MLTRVVAHVVALWGRRWVLPLLPLVYALIMAAVGTLRSEHIVIALTVAALGFATAVTKRILVIAFPALLVAAGYDLLRFVQPIFVVPQRVLGCSMRNLELTLFGLTPTMTFADYFAAHHAPVFDLYFAIPYGAFLYVAIAYGIYLFFNDRPRMTHFIWSFSTAYLIAFVLWLVMPTAPPWYIAAHGCVIDPSAPPSAAALIRVDQLLGIHYFEDFYARSPATFAAFPSMHCASPMIGLLVAWRAATWTTRPLHLLYAASMLVGSVYLDHHWLIDGFAGWMVAAIAVFGTQRMLKPAVPAPTAA